MATYNGTTNSDTYTGTSAADTISGLDGNDNLSGGNGNDTINGDSGIDYLSGDAGDDTLNGGDGNDDFYYFDAILGDVFGGLFGGDGNDTLNGGAGKDFLDGGEGADTYVFAQGDGADTISNYHADTSIDTIKFSNIASTAALYFVRADADLVFNYGSDSITLYQFFSADFTAINSTDAIGSFKFSNAVTWGYAELFAHQQGTTGSDTLYAINGYANTISAMSGNDDIYGGDGADTLNGGDGVDYLYGNGGADTLNGGVGNDDLTGGEGADTYLISKTDGVDTIDNYDSDASVDAVKFTNLKSTELTALYDDGSGNLILKYGTAGNQLKIQGFFNNYAYARVDKFIFTDSTLTADTIITTRHNGTDASEYLYGVTGYTNTLNGLGGNDILNGRELADTLNGGSGNDRLDGYLGDDVLNGNEGNDNIYGGDGNDTLNGGEDNDYIDGGAGNDTLNGNTGGDTLNGGNGSDTYVFALGDGGDKITDGSGDDVVKFSNVASTAVTSITRSLYDLIISYGSTDKLTITNFFDVERVNDAYAIGSFQFNDAVTWGYAELFARQQGTTGNDTLYAINGYDNTIYALAGNDTIYGADYTDTLIGGDGVDNLYGKGGADTLSGGIGNDTLEGGEARDTYVFALGDGTDKINNAHSDTSSDVVKFSNVASSDVRSITRSGDDLVMAYGSTDMLTITSFFSEQSVNTTNAISSFQFSNAVTWGYAELFAHQQGTTGNDTLYGISGYANTINALEGNDNVYGSDGNDTLNGGNGSDYLFGDYGNDTLNGGSGDDILTGGDGADTYLISKTDGADNIYNYDNDGSIDTVKFTDLKSTELTALYDDGSGNLILKYGTAGNQLKIYGFFGDYANAKVDQFTFTDKTITADTIITTRHNGTDANDYLYGLAGKTNTLNGLDGNDYLNGAELTDTLNGGNGSDQLYGNQGADLLNGDSGDDYNSNFGNFGDGGLFGGDGNDIINGGLGIDYLSGDAGDDILNGGDGNDDVYFFDSSTGIEYFGGLFGGEGNDILNGNAGNDYLEGGEGADTYGFALGDGADWINNSHSDTSIDVVKFSNVASSIVTSITRSGDELVITYGSTDVLTVAGFFTGITYAIGSFQFSDGVTLNSFIIGSTANDSLNGTSLNDAISGLAGADSMSGGLGNDLYFVDNTGDVVTEASNAGNDTVLSTINYTLTANVENLALQGSAQTATGNGGSNTLTGNKFINTLTGLGGNDELNGNSGNDVLLGGDGNDKLNGGTGADAMSGGQGNDSYTVDNMGDSITELANQGTDTVTSGIAWTLGANLENLTLSGTKAINGSGNTLNNTIIGNSAANLLSGDTGTDSLTGGNGMDVLIGGIGKDKLYLAETVAVTDTVKISTGDSKWNGYDEVANFALGKGLVNSKADRLDLDTTAIASNAAAVNGVDKGIIKSHNISNGLISFDDIDSFAASLVLTASNLTDVFGYLQNNIKSGNTVAFNAVGNTYVFQDGGLIDTVVQLTGVTASNINTTGLVTDGVWLV